MKDFDFYKYLNIKNDGEIDVKFAKSGTYEGLAKHTIGKQAMGFDVDIKDSYLEQEVDTALKSNFDLFDNIDKVYAKDHKCRYIPMGDGKFRVSANDSVGAYPTSTLEYIDYDLITPLRSYFHDQLIPKRYGMGAVDTIARFKSDENLVDMTLHGQINNSFKQASFDFEKKVSEIYPFVIGEIYGKYELIKSEKANIPTMQMKNKLTRESYNVLLEKLAFIGNLGLPNASTVNSVGFRPGLLNVNAPMNLDLETQTVIPGLPKTFEAFTYQNWIDFFVKIIEINQLSVHYRDGLMFDTILMPPAYFTQLQRLVSVGNNTLISTNALEVVEKAISQSTNRDIKLVKMPYVQANTKRDYGYFINEAGVNNSNQIVFYSRSSEAFYMPIAMELTGGALEPSPTEFGWRRNYMALVGTPFFFWLNSICRVSNGITANTVSVTWNLNGGNISGSTAEVVVNQIVGSNILDGAPTPTQEGKTLVGWGTTAETTTPIANNTKVTTATTLYAIWEDEEEDEA